MRISTFVFTTLALVVPALSAPPSLAIRSFEGEKTGLHIVQLNDGVSIDPILARINMVPSHKWSLINGFAGKFEPSILTLLLGIPGVKSVSEDGIMHTTGGSITQTNAPWGLARLSSVDKLANQNASTLNFKYTYDKSAGQNTDIYIVDTGVRITHKQFGDRARWGKTFGGYPDADGNGHGTHCAGTAAGSQFGVAKKANIIAVKVLSDEGSGSVSDIISGLEFVAEEAKKSRRPSIASMSLGGAVSKPLDDSVKSLIKQNIHVIVAAGNDDKNAAEYSPAHVPEVVTVGASTIGDARADFSNYGSVLDIFAPGLSIISAWKDSDEATKSLSGTSMATPHVAGLVAYFIGRDGNVSPADMSKKLKDTALKGKLSNIPSRRLGCSGIPFLSGDCTPNLLAHNV